METRKEFRALLMAEWLNPGVRGAALSKWRECATVAFLLASLAACTVGPDYVRPKTEVPPSYKELKGWKKAQPKDFLSRGAWWKVFGDPRLNALEAQVSITNQNLAVSEAQFRQALAAVKVAQSGFFPVVSALTSAQRSRNPLSLSSGTSSSAGPSGVTSSNLQLAGNVSWELDLWGKIRRTVEASKANARASDADLEGVRLAATAQLAQDYFQLRALDSQQHILHKTVEAYQQFLQLTKNRYATGVASPADVLQAKTQLKTAQAQEIDTGVQRAQFEHAIALLMGKAPSDVTIPPSPLDLTPPAVPAGIPSELLERRPDIAAAERQAAAANAQIGVAIAAYYPTVTLNASGGFEAASAAQWLVWPARVWSLGPAVLGQTLFEGGLRHAQTEEARAAYDASVATYRETVLAAFQQVEDNLAALRILEQEALVQNEAVDAARKSVAVERNQYKAGIASALDVIVVQAIALNNELTAAKIQGNRMVDDVLLIQALGGGWQAGCQSFCEQVEKSCAKQCGVTSDSGKK
ncbi:MAG: efflux transporter outer membrane subunit [Syntrophobacteraceae bacterium]|nr:efflux transporter outer membrane subunit [Syntrophobacteraceae bacterium]